ncbi:MAG TPA: hypothetical protein VHR66_15610 [Gemmataceae bacterium]|jgi:hypothetical protein|nr:hypothetical protein [Gemmataceae bacterium]
MVPQPGSDQETPGVVEMKFRLFVAAVVAAALTLPAYAENMKSGPQTGEKVPGPFHPVNVTGEHKGEKFCLFCVNGENPVAMVFARENSPELAKLVKKIDEATVKNKDKSMGSFVVFLSDKEGLDKELAAMADKAAIAKTVLAIDNPAGPKAYNVAKDADITVVLYTDRKVKANHAFKKGEMKDSDIEKIVSEVPMILEASK